MNESIVNRVKAAGSGNARMLKEDHAYAIQIRVDGQWQTVTKGLTHDMAEQILKEGSNKLLFG